MSADTYTPHRPFAAVCAAGMAALVYGAALSLLVGATSPPLAQAATGGRDDPRDERPRDGHDQGRRGGERGHDNGQRERDERQRYEREHYWQHQQPVYVPPPVYYYPPQASPGINLILPLELRFH